MPHIKTCIAYICLTFACSLSVNAVEPFQPWVKQGRILPPGFAGRESTRRLSAPSIVKLKNGRLRMYFWAIGESGSQFVFAAECSPKSPTQWTMVSKQPLLGPDRSGNLRNQGPSFPFVVRRDDGPWLMYFCSWGSWAKPGELSNRTSMALSEDEGLTWKVNKEPLLPLGPAGTFDAGMTGSVCVIRDRGSYHMWYTAGERYLQIGNSKRGIVHLGYCTSKNGISWERHPQAVMSPRLKKAEPFEAVVSKPSVLKLADGYHMWFSVYQLKGRGYQLAYASSKDGIHWQRAFDKRLLQLTPGGFDSRNQSYPNVVEVGDELWMYYVGNYFGNTGIGWAKMKKSQLAKIQ